MITAAQIKTLKRVLFKDPQLRVYAVLDGASIEDLLGALAEMQPDYVCLYRGELDEEMAVCAPYLVRLDEESQFTDWVLGYGWGQHWGIFALADVDSKAMRKHFRTFLMVSDPEGKQLYFRYYDPRVLRLYLPTCTVEEMQLVFGPVSCFALEDPSARSMLVFSRAPNGLASSSLPLS